MEDQHEVEFEEYEESWTGRIAIAVVVALVLIGGAFFAGRAMAGSGGPATLAEAVAQAQAGDLPCGETGTAARPPPAPRRHAAAAGGAAPGGAGFIAARDLPARRPAGRQAPAARVAGRFGGAGGGFGQTGQVTRSAPTRSR